MIWHSSSFNEVLSELDVKADIGLTNSEVDNRIADYGQNYVKQIKKTSFLKRFVNQLTSKTVIALIIIALVSMGISFAYPETSSASPLLIIAIVVLNALISAYQLYSSDNSLDKIKEMTNPSATVLREGIVRTILSANLVPGDIILLDEGDYIPADARLIEVNEFRCNEMLLTGSEIPVDKNADRTFDEISSVEERANMIWSGTSVVHGTAKAVVVATALNTEIGKASTLLQQSGEDKLPLEEQLDSIGKIVNAVILAVCVLVFLIGMVQNFTVRPFADITVKVLMNSVALAVAAIPESLPAITTIVIATGIHRILGDNIIVKDASAAELLGKTDIICCDKTGVFTRNKMTLTTIFDGKRTIDLKDEAIDELSATVIKAATACSTLDNDSTEHAIEKACLAYCSMSKQDISDIYPHIAEIPFDSYRKTMTVITMINERPFAIVKGAPENVVPKCVGCSAEEILKVNAEMADRALRVVCIGMRPLETIPATLFPEEIETDLTFVGLLGIEDLPREGVTADIAACDQAGIKTLMVTGDNLVTATTIARRIGIFKDGTLAITGAELEAMSDEELCENIEKYTVFARISPSDKVRIVKAWQQRGKVITITGDSIQDADALALADVGCAIGKFGTDVAKGNADIIISNNRFSSVVNAVRESRGLFSNIKKSVFYLFSCNFAEIIAFVFGLLIFKSVPVAAAQLLWINLLTDCAPAFSLSLERAETDIMKADPLSSFGKIFNLTSFIGMAIQSIFIAVITLIAFSFGFDFGDTALAMTMAFVTLSLTQIFHCINCKFEGSFFGKKLFTNSFMNFALLITVLVIFFLVLTPAGALFGLVTLTVSQLLLCLFLALLVLPIGELTKFLTRRFIKPILAEKEQNFE